MKGISVGFWGLITRPNTRPNFTGLNYCWHLNNINDKIALCAIFSSYHAKVAPNYPH